MNTSYGSQCNALSGASQNPSASHETTDLSDPNRKGYSAYRLRFGELKPGRVHKGPPLGSHLLITCTRLLARSDSRDANISPRHQLRFKGWVALGKESAKSVPPDTFFDDIHSIVNNVANGAFVNNVFTYAAYELENPTRLRHNHSPEIFAAQKPAAGFQELYNRSKTTTQASNNLTVAADLMEGQSPAALPARASTAQSGPKRRFNPVYSEYINPPPTLTSSRKDTNKVNKVCPPMEVSRAAKLSQNGYELPPEAKVMHELVWENPDGKTVTVGTQTPECTVGTVRETDDAQRMGRVQQDLIQGLASQTQKYQFPAATQVSLVRDPITGQPLPSWSLATGGETPAGLDLDPWYSSGGTLDQGPGSQLGLQGTDLFDYAVPEGGLLQYGGTVLPQWQSDRADNSVTSLQTPNYQNLIQAGAGYDLRLGPGAPTHLLDTDLGAELDMAYQYGPDGGFGYENVYGEPSLQAGRTQVADFAMNQHPSYATAINTPSATDPGIEHRLTAESASSRRSIGTDAIANEMFGQSTNTRSPPISQPTTKRRKRDAQVPSSFMSEFPARPNPTPTITRPHRNRGTDVRILGSGVIPQGGQESVRHGSAGLSTNPASTPANRPHEPSNYAADTLQGHERIGSLRPSLYQHSVMLDDPETLPASIGFSTRQSRDPMSPVSPAPEQHGKRRNPKPRK